ncbi:YybH family protein [Chitinophaga qingshengii]|uniref:Nuclear transport factor 2 family protein n=1 Tax=Chitinophaga qingshengii TaxID=1569794 RepID=A0ABR7TIE9_9BACT|nr:nuclear transport factor 2 family protein [Chitinophaga qingshengii]MBC9929733.1 nuclear transport factor 2 family protein [Chitinophaga qingshengii]
MKTIIPLLLMAILAFGCQPTDNMVSAADKKALLKTTQAIRDGFARGDVPAILALHHPEVIKYFGGKNVVIGREAMKKGLTEMFAHSKMEFVDHELESLVFHDNTAVETSIFTIKVTHKNGAPPTLAHGRAMVVYVKYKDSPTGWASIREMAQEAP